MKLTTASTMISAIALIASLIFTYTMLGFINAPTYLYGIWALTFVIQIVSLLISITVRDESFKQQFETLRKQYQ
jgi:uncharacterized membrane protein YkvI